MMLKIGAVKRRERVSHKLAVRFLLLVLTASILIQYGVITGKLVIGKV